MPARDTTSRTNRSPASYCSIFLSKPIARWNERSAAAGPATALRERSPHACEVGDVVAATSFITYEAWPSSSDITPWTWRTIARCSSFSRRKAAHPADVGARPRLVDGPLELPPKSFESRETVPR